jgi:hypothetical protein
MYHRVDHLKIIISAQIVYLCALYGSQNKQRYFPIQHLLTSFYNQQCLLRSRTCIFKYNSRLTETLQG